MLLAAPTGCGRRCVGGCLGCRSSCCRSGRGFGLRRRRSAVHSRGRPRKGETKHATRTNTAATANQLATTAAAATAGRPLLLHPRHLIAATSAAPPPTRLRLLLLLRVHRLLLLLLSAVELPLLLLQRALLLLLLGRHQVRAAVRLFDGLQVDFVPVQFTQRW